MRLSAIVLAFAATASGLSIFKQDVITNDDDLKIPGDSPLQLCPDKDHSKDLATIDKVDLSPNPPEAGKELSIKASGTVLETIEQGAYINIQVKYGLIRLINQKMDLCEQVKNVDIECPIEKGVINVVKTVDIPREVPPGKYTVVADVFTVDGRQLTCLTAQVVFGRHDVLGSWEL